MRCLPSGWGEPLSSSAPLDWIPQDRSEIQTQSTCQQLYLLQRWKLPLQITTSGRKEGGRKGLKKKHKRMQIMGIKEALEFKISMGIICTTVKWNGNNESVINLSCYMSLETCHSCQPFLCSATQMGLWEQGGGPQNSIFSFIRNYVTFFFFMVRSERSFKACFFSSSAACVRLCLSDCSFA